MLHRVTNADTGEFVEHYNLYELLRIVTEVYVNAELVYLADKDQFILKVGNKIALYIQ